jgi:nucleoside-diphosphate-sugar epimerase
VTYPFTRQYSLKVLEKSLRSDDRLIITGASGWFGQTLAALISKLEVPTLFIASSERVLPTPYGSIPLEKFDISRVRRFQPTLLVDLAALTREKVGRLGNTEFTEKNNALLSTAIEIFELESVRASIFASSGAATDRGGMVSGANAEPYAAFKRLTEDVFEQSASSLGKPALGIRVWSVSGPLVTKPSIFAFSSILLQAITGIVEFKSAGPVLRRYVSVDDLFALAFASLREQRAGTKMMESGGDLIEIRELANKALNLMGHQNPSYLPDSTTGQANSYFSDNLSWLSICREMEFEPEKLDAQITRNLAGYLSRGMG